MALFYYFVKSKHSTMINKVPVESVADIRFGLYAQPGNTGSVIYLQVRQFNESGRLTSEDDEFINLDSKSEQHLLRDGDVLFVGKGNRLFSWCYHKKEKPAVASSIFFVLRPNLKKVHPEYLAIILNAPQSKAAFQQIGAGTNILSIRKSELGAFQIPLPPLKQQQDIASLAQLHQEEIWISQQLIMQKENLYNAILKKLLK